MSTDKELGIKVTAKAAGVKELFTGLASSADKLGTEMKSAGAESAKALDGVGKSAKQMAADVAAADKQAASAHDLLAKNAGALAGALTGGLVAGLKAVSAASEDSAAKGRQLDAAFTAAGLSSSDYSKQLAALSKQAVQRGIDDELAGQALQTLISMNVDASQAFQLVGTAEDLAAAKGMDLVSAATLIGKVYEGNTSAAVRAGVAIDANATSQEALAQITQTFSGQAEAHTKLLDVWGVKLGNLEEAAGGALGGISPFLTVLPGLSTGFGIVSTAGGALIDVLRAQRAASAASAAALEAQTVAAGEAAAASEVAGVAEAGIAGGLLGPIGLVAGLGAAAAAFFLFKGGASDSAESANAAAAAYGNLAGAVQNLAASGSPNAGPAKQSQDLLDTLLYQTHAVQNYNDALDQYVHETTDQANLYTNEDRDAAMKALSDTTLIVNQIKATGVTIQELSDKQQTDISKSLASLFNHEGINAGAAEAAFNELVKQFEAGTLKAGDFDTAVQGLADNWPQFATGAASASAQVNALNTQIDSLLARGNTDWQNAVWGNLDVKPIQDVVDSVFGSGAGNAKGFQDAIKGIFQSVKDGSLTAQDAYAAVIALGGQFNATVDAATIATENAGRAAQAASVAQYGWADSYAAVARERAHLNTVLGERNAAYALDQQQATMFGPDSVGAQGAAAAAGAISTHAATITDAYAQMGSASIANGAQGSAYFAAQAAATTAADEALRKYITDLGLMPTALDVMAAASGNASAIAADGAIHATTALTDMQRVIIGNTDSIKQQSDSLLKWADDLIGAEGVSSKLDDLVNKGLISGQSGNFTGNNDYANAQRAYNDIAADNLRITTATEVIQAKQAPILADLANKQADYLEKIEAMKPAEQLAALGFMDSAESAKAMQLQSMAAAAAMGQLGDKGEESTKKIIEGAAEADPALAAMLESMGLISMGADGTITVNFPTGETVQSAIDGLQTSINNLAALEYIISIGADTSDFWDHVNGLDGQHVGQAWIDVGYVPTITYAPGYGAYVPGSMLGGVIQSHAAGGVVSRLAEAGPELLDYPGGGHGLAMNNGLYSVPPGTFVHTAPATKAMGPGVGARNFIHNGNVYNYPSSGSSARDQAQAAILGERR